MQNHPVLQWRIQDLQTGRAKVEHRPKIYFGEGPPPPKKKFFLILKLTNSSNSGWHFCSLAIGTYYTSKKHCFWPPMGACPPGSATAVLLPVINHIIVSVQLSADKHHIIWTWLFKHAIYFSQ